MNSKLLIIIFNFAAFIEIPITQHLIKCKIMDFSKTTFF